MPEYIYFNFFFFEKTTHFNEKLYLGFKPHFSEGIHPEIYSQPLLPCISHMFSSYPSYLNPIQILSVGLYRVSQNSRIPNSERGREGPSGARKYVEKKIRSS
jgi:hypothetical protein